MRLPIPLSGAVVRKRRIWAPPLAHKQPITPIVDTFISITSIVECVLEITGIVDLYYASTVLHLSVLFICWHDPPTAY
jgi:hypothetical protein